MDEARKRKILVLEYTAVQILFWVGSCCTTGYAAVFLRGRGLINTYLGITLALGSIASLLLSSVLSTIVDKYKKINVFHCLFGLLSAEAVLEVSIAMSHGAGLPVCLMQILLASCVGAAQPLINQMPFFLDRSGRNIKYGFSRSMGSLFYVPVTLTVGRLCSDISVEILPKLGLGAVFAQIVLYAVILLIKKNIDQDEAAAREKTESSGLGMWQFVQENKRFFAFAVGMVFIFFSHCLSGVFTINLVEALGGDASGVGIYTACLALFEVPFMFGYTRIINKYKCSSIITFAALMYIIRAAATAFAPTLNLLYASTVMQGLSYALITPALVDYASRVVDRKDSAKAQAVVMASVTVGSILASCLGGVMLDALSVKKTMVTAVGICCVGVAVVLSSIDRKHA